MLQLTKMMTQSFIRYWLIGAGLLWLVTIGEAEANLILNGGFENGFTNWSHLGKVDVVATEGSSEGTLAAVFNGGNMVGSGVLSQSFGTSIGQSYRLELDYGVFWGGLLTQPSQTQNLRVELLGAGTLFNQILSDTGSNPVTFDSFISDFTADSSTTTLRFTDLTTLSQSGNNDFLVDRVSVSRNSIPEPTTITLLLVALALTRIGFVRCLGNRSP